MSNRRDEVKVYRLAISLKGTSTVLVKATSAKEARRIYFEEGSRDERVEGLDTRIEETGGALVRLDKQETEDLRKTESKAGSTKEKA